MTHLRFVIVASAILILTTVMFTKCPIFVNNPDKTIVQIVNDKINE